MNRNIVRILISVVAVWLSLSVVDLLYSRAAAKSNCDFIRYWSYLMEGRIDADCLALGSSRCLNHIMPARLDSAMHVNSYNLGMSRAHISDIYARYKLYRLRNEAPTLVLMVLDPYTINRVDNEASHFQYYPWFHDRLFRRTVFPLVRFPLAERLLPLYRYRGWGIPFIHSQRDSLEKGFLGLDTSFDPEKIKEFSLDFTVDPEAEALLSEFLDTLEADGASVAFVLSPMHDVAIEKMTDLPGMLAYYGKIAGDRKIPVYDLHEMPFSSDESYFVNHTHLNRKGAREFTDSLVARIGRNA